MMILTTQEIAQFRSQLSEYEEVMEALDLIEDCEGDLEDAAISLALKVGMEPNTSENWLKSEAKRCRVSICEAEFREDLVKGNLTKVVGYLLEKKVCPPVLAAPVVIYALKTGIEEFCQPLDYKL